MYARVVSYIREHDLLRAGDRVVAGVSGGADSVCLLHLLVRLREETGLTVCAVHVHHGIRGAEADRDADFVKALAAGWNVPCRVVHADVRGYAGEKGLSEEEAGRILRYRALAEEAARLDHGPRGTRIAVGHQKEDQAETILHNLFRGSALKGLAGMAPSGILWEPSERGCADHGEEDEREGIYVIRPLLCVSREEIREYLARHHLTFCEDSTNETTDYTRNRIRQLLPQICRDVNGRAVDHILAAGERIARADAYFESEAARIWTESGVVEGFPESPVKQEGPPEESAGTHVLRRTRCGIPAAVLGDAPEILAGYLAMKMIKLMTGSVKDITSVHAEQIRGLARRGTGKQASLPYGLRAVREYEMIWLEKAPAGAEESALDRVRPETITFSRFAYEKNQKIPENRYTKWFDYDKIEGALSVRARRTGDYITLKGGCRKSIKSYMIDEKIPRSERDRILLLAEGSHVLWIVGYRISEYYKVTEETKEILQAQAYGEEEAAADGAADSAPGRRRGQTCGGEKHGR